MCVSTILRELLTIYGIQELPHLTDTRIITCGETQSTWNKLGIAVSSDFSWVYIFCNSSCRKYEYWKTLTIPVNLRILEIPFFWTLRTHSSTPLPSTATIRSYLCSAQQVLTGESQPNIRKPIITILALNYGRLPRNTGDLTGLTLTMRPIVWALPIVWEAVTLL